MAPPLHESLALAPRDASILDNNQWPDFPLTQVDITNAKTGKPASLLDANVDTPLTITGKLDRLPNDRLQYLHARISTPVVIEVTNVHTFSYGQYEEGDVALWAAGLAGWFEIKPSRAYRAIFQDMLEAVNALYFTADAHRGVDRHKLKKVYAETIFESYAEEPSHKCRDVAQAEGVFKKHQRFLLDSMKNGKEGIRWRSTWIYDYLLQEAKINVSDGTTQAVETPSPNGDESIEERNTARLAIKGKSALRPRSIKYSMKAAGRRPTSTTDDLHDSIVKPSAPLTQKSVQQHSGRHLRGAMRKAKRKAAEVEEEALLSPLEDESTATDRPLPLLPHAPLSRRRKSNPFIRLIEKPLPSYEAQGPGDVWMCTFDGCCHRVYAASTSASRELIKEHFKSHAMGAQTQLDLVYKEERPYLPVGNLLKRIREIATHQRPVAAEQEAVVWPKPIETKC